MIAASATPDVPWGYVCGYPTNRGDLYGGAHYSQSSSATLTPQGRAIAAASRRFGNGETLPFTPCKKGYIPVVAPRGGGAIGGTTTDPGRAMFACHLHDRFRRQRYLKENSKFRPGEVDLKPFWSNMGTQLECQHSASRSCIKGFKEVSRGGVPSAETNPLMIDCKSHEELPKALETPNANDGPTRKHLGAESNGEIGDFLWSVDANNNV